MYIIIVQRVRIGNLKETQKITFYDVKQFTEYLTEMNWSFKKVLYAGIENRDNEARRKKERRNVNRRAA